eukprot:1832933-Alexandrium_andersonii.AAC.1
MGRSWLPAGRVVGSLPPDATIGRTGVRECGSAPNSRLALVGVAGHGQNSLGAVRAQALCWDP